MQKMEVVVVAKTWDEAKEILAIVGIDEKSKINYKVIDGLFLVSVDKSESLTDEEYNTIRLHPHVAIHSDSASRKRIGEVLDRVYDVETQLRKLLLHVSDSVEIYFEIFKASSKYTKGFVSQQSITINGSLNPITSHLTLGEIQKILDYDISLGNKPLSLETVSKLLEASPDLESLKKSVLKGLKVSRVWDVIAENILPSAPNWRDVSNEIDKLKTFRDSSAHYQIITSSEKDELIKVSNWLLKKLTPKQNITKQNQKELAGLAGYLRNNYFSTLQQQYFIDVVRKNSPELTDFSKRVAEMLESASFKGSMKSAAAISGGLNKMLYEAYFKQNLQLLDDSENSSTNK